MKDIVRLFALSLLICTGCRTYVGSDDVFVTTPPEVLESESGLELKRGAIFKTEGGNWVLTFVERSVTRNHERTKTYYCGRQYYYLDRSELYADNFAVPNVPPAVFWLTIFALPFQWGHDGFYSWKFDWKRQGEYAPGIGYCIAYLPIMHLFFSSVLRPPYAYNSAKYCIDFDDDQSIRLAKETTYQRNISVLTPDVSETEIMISLGGKPILRRESPNGQVAFGITDFPFAAFDGENIELIVVHREWGQRWSVRTPPIVEPAALRDWNIFSDAKYDYPTRLQALVRLEPALGEKRCIDYLRQLLAGKLNIKPIFRAEINISGNPAVAPGIIRKPQTEPEKINDYRPYDQFFGAQPDPEAKLNDARDD